MKTEFLKSMRFAALSAGGLALSWGQDVDMGALSLKRILDLDVTSVSKHAQKMRDVPTSIYVINEDEIRRSGATRLQDVLKLAPGAFFSDVSYSNTTQGVREGMGVFNHTVAWILDGVPVTNPIIGGMFFNVLDFPLEDIERIEVIKGPGGVVYGANSASGIISIFTKRGEAAEGLRLSLAGGTQNYLAPYVRYGVEAKDDLFLTLWGRFKTHDGYDRNPLFAGETVNAPINGGAPVPVANRFLDEDDYQRAFSGGVKWEYQPKDEWKWSGQVLESAVANGQYSLQLTPWPESAPPAGQPEKMPDSIHANREIMEQTIVQARLDVTRGRDDSWFVNAYHWRNRYDVALQSGNRIGYDISELEAQRNLALRSHGLSAGANVRRVQFEFADMRDNGSNFVSDPHNLSFLWGAFLQDEIGLGGRWRLTLGAKAEIWTLISDAPEISPSLRLAWKPAEDLTFWGAASRSITMPTYAQTDIEVRQAQIPPYWYFQNHKDVLGDVPRSPAMGRFVALVPGAEASPVEYYTLETGHRGSLAGSLQWDLSAFYSWVNGMTGATPFDSSLQTVIPSRAHPPDTIVPVYETNLADYQSFGGEAILRYVPAEFLRMELSYALFYIRDFTGRAIPGDTTGRTYHAPADELRRTPNHVGRAKLFCDLPFGINLFTSGILSSPFARGEAFNYYEQLPMSQTRIHAQSLVADAPRVQFQLDFSIQKRLFGDRVTLTAWGRNVLAEPFVENYNQFGWISFPHQTHRTFGGGLVYQF
jgi:outer membrane receptor protein involved in Fe transport